MAKKKTNSNTYVRQYRREFRSVEIIDTSKPSVPRKSQHHFDLIKSNLADGCTSSTSIFDEECGEVPSIFNQSVSPLDLADELLRAGMQKQAQKVAEDGGKSNVN